MYPFPYNNLQNKPEDILVSEFNLNHSLDQNKHTNFILDLYLIKSYSSCKERNPKTSFAGSWAKQTVSSNQKPFVLKILYDSNSTKSLLVCQTESKKMTKNSSKVELCKKIGSTNE